MPTKVIWGTADSFLTIGHGYRLAHDLNARLEHIEGGKHFVPEDPLEFVAQVINDLLEQLRAAELAGYEFDVTRLKAAKKKSLH
jgi:pimeloyl-ACP methyl ester carboxylesterase